MNPFWMFASKYKCLVYIAFGSQDYSKIIHRLQSHGVKYRTKTYHNLNVPTGYFPKVDNTQYDIYVTYEDEHLAKKAIHAH